MGVIFPLTGLWVFLFLLPGAPLSAKEVRVKEEAVLTYAPNVPLPIQRRKPAIVHVHLDSSVQVMELGLQAKYEFWTFNGHIPGPFIRGSLFSTVGPAL